MKVSTVFEANTETTEVMQPDIHAFNDRATLTKAAAVFGTVPSDHRLGTTIAQRSSMLIGAVPPSVRDGFIKALLSPLQSVPADHGATEFEERFMNVGTPFESETETPKVVHPGMRALNDPSNLPKPAAVWLSASGYAGGNAALAQDARVLVVIVASIRIDAFGPAQ